MEGDVCQIIAPNGVFDVGQFNGALVPAFGGKEGHRATPI